MKFRVIQSNNRGLITGIGDKTFSSKKPKLGEEYKALPTLFIWVNSPKRFVARVWTKWTGEKISNDFIYEVTNFRDIIDISGMNHFHQWSNNHLRMKLWEMEGEKIELKKYKCSDLYEVWEGSRNKKSKYLKKRKDLIKNQLKDLNKKEIELIEKLYKKKNKLNLDAGFIKFNVDHIKPLSKGGLHKFNNLRIISAIENQIKGSKIVN